MNFASHFLRLLPVLTAIKDFMFGFSLRLLIVQCLLAVQVHGQEAVVQPARIAIAGPMSGTSASVGTQFQAGVLAALELETDGTLLGRPLVVTEYDDRCRANIAKSLAAEIADTQPVLVIGHSCSSATLAAVPIYNQHHILQITPASTATDITQLGVTTLFRMLGRDDEQGLMAARYIQTHHADARIGIVRFPSQYSIGTLEVAIQQLQVAGAQVVQVTDALSSAPSYLDQVLELQSADVDVVYIVGGALDVGVFTRQANMLQSRFSIISADSLISATFPEVAGPNAEDVLFTFPAEASQHAAPERFSEIATAISRHSDIAARGYALLSYAAVQVWIAGVTRADSFDASLVADAIRSQPITTILGNISFDAKGDIVTQYPAFSWHVWRNGEHHVME
jgi:branched-chain amino acid transport system substrate-binding protein